MRKRNKLLRPMNADRRIWRGSVWFSSATAFCLLVLCPANRAQSQTQNQLNGAAAVETSVESDDSLLKSVQNPVADLISVPILNTTNFNIGPYGRGQNVLAAQPVIPANLTENWMLISRIILPLTWQPYPDNNTGGQFGLGDMTPSFFLAPRNPGSVIWARAQPWSFPLPPATFWGKASSALVRRWSSWLSLVSGLWVPW